MSEILDRIFIGSQQDAINEAFIKQKSISSIINVNNREIDEERILIRKYGFIQYIYLFCNYYNISNLKMAAGYLYGAYHDSSKKYNILVHCEGGIDRAPFVVAFFLHFELKIPIEKAYQMIRKIRPQIIEHYEWI
jgi:protein tyrosine/serine phosphatase